MREIKFRARATKEYETSQDGIEVGDWVYGHYYFSRQLNSGVIVTTLDAECGGMGPGFITVHVEIDIKTLGQYTGLHEKNGTEIYEGDVVRYKQAEGGILSPSGNSYICVIKWGPMHGWECVNIESEYKKYTLASSHFEVLGNIHENPELLEIN